MPADMAEITEGGVLFAIHEHLRARQLQEALHQADIVLQVDHGHEDAPHDSGIDRVRKP